MNALPGRTPMVIRDITDAIAAIPYLLGFHPVDSLVVIGYDGPYNTCAVRVDLPEDEPGEAAGRAAEMLGENKFRRALVVGYGPADRVRRAALIANERLLAHGLTLTDAARVADGRWWSLTCTDAECCAPAGHPCDISSSLVAAQATYSGHVALADRSELTRTVAPLTGPARATMQEATRRVEKRLKTWKDTLPPTQYRRRIIQKGLTLLATLRNYPQPHPPPTNSHASDPQAHRIKDEGSTNDHPTNSPGPTGQHTPNSSGPTGECAAQLAGPTAEDVELAVDGGEGEARSAGASAVASAVAADHRVPRDEEVAWLGFLLLDLRVRDEAWVRINEDDPAEDIRFWRDILCRVDDAFADAPASLLAYAAYVGGDGGLANVALDRASPDYSMAALLRGVIDAGVPPSEVRIRMTPEDLADVYAEEEEEE